MGTAGWGDRLRERGRALGLSDSEVARRLGLSQRRYSSYVNETREPSFNDLLRICEVLGTTPDYVLGAGAPDEADGALRRAGAALAGRCPSTSASWQWPRWRGWRRPPPGGTAGPGREGRPVTGGRQ